MFFRTEFIVTDIIQAKTPYIPNHTNIFLATQRTTDSKKLPTR